MPIAAVLGAVGSIAGAAISAKSAQSAAATQANAALSAAQIQANSEAAAAATLKEGESQGVTAELSGAGVANAQLQPYSNLGMSATYSLADLYGLPTPNNPNGGQAFNPASTNQFLNSPDYQFAKQQGIAGLDSSAAAKGQLLSGGQLKAITDYSSGLATQNFGNYVSRLGQLASLGPSSATQLGDWAMNSGSNIANTEIGTSAGVANTQVGAGNALAAGTTGAANATASGQVASNNLIGGGISDAFSNLALYRMMNTSSPTGYGGSGGGGGSSYGNGPIGSTGPY